MKWRTEIKLKFRRKPRWLGWEKKLVGFRFEWKAWLIAYDIFSVSPAEFLKLPADDQMTSLIYGAAEWDCIKTGKRMFFDYPDIKEALLHATKQEGIMLNDAIAEAQFPEWMKNVVPGGKKKMKGK